MTVVVTHSTPSDSSFSASGAVAWDASHTLAGVGTMAGQDASTVAITGGAIDGTTVGNGTPAAGTFTTLIATGQTSLGGVAGAESIRAIVPSATGNYWQFEGASGDVAVRINGGSSNIGAAFVSKGSSNFNFATATSASNVQFRIAHTASAVNYVQVTGGATGSPGVVTMSAQGSSTDVDIAVTPKGAGVVKFATYTAGVIAQAGYITIKDSGGTVRRLLVG